MKIASEQHNVMEKEKFYRSSFSDEEQLDFKQALGVVGFIEEVALVRVKIKYILKNMPSNIILLLRVLNSLQTLVRLQQRDKQDSLARIQKLMDTEFKSNITAGKPVTVNLHELMANSVRPHSKKTAPSSDETSTVTVPLCSNTDASPPIPQENKLKAGISASPESINSPSPCTESPAGSAMPHESIQSNCEPNPQEFEDEVSTLSPVSSEKSVPRFQHSNSLYRRKKHHKKH
jgi:hypothetical protein